jgi:cytoplasmic iron level regulating protein YaaA (DUF328/UPF0246 family)
MLILLSPAKTLDFSPTARDLSLTKPALHSDTKKLAKVCQGLSEKQLAKMMLISVKLAATTHSYFAAWRQKWDAKGTKQAVLAFRGDVYQGLDADSLTDKQLEVAQQHVRILSGLYGVLCPLDLMQAYRLEMGTKLKTERGKNLYEWWGDRVTDALNADLEQAKEPLVVNLASNEYWSVVQPKRLEARILTPAFKEKKGTGYKVVSFYAKRARGEMTRHLITTRQQGPAAIKSFAASGYRYNASQSTPDGPVFTRDQPLT